MKATLKQLAWYLERDGARVVSFSPDGAQTVRVPLGSAGHITYVVPGHLVDDLNRERDAAYAAIAAKRRAAR